MNKTLRATGLLIAGMWGSAGCGLLVGVEDVDSDPQGGSGGGGGAAGTSNGGANAGGAGGGPGAVCGDQIVMGDEDCDDGNSDDYDACRNNCRSATCGDGVVWTGIEQCDDANNSNSDACVAGCLLATCGDGHVRIGVEGCDDGNQIDSDACRNNCSPATCGDGIVQIGEACDDANFVNTDECLETCQMASCGDGYLRSNSAEQCDDGNGTQTDPCLNDCTPNQCGDGHRNVGVEPCDDGNSSNTDGCLNGCAEASCGDGFVFLGVEPCDDGNLSNTDSCLTSCAAAACGDGFIHAGVEDCEDGNASNNDACVQCMNASCGDGFVRTGVEACDDANAITGDGCHLCTQVVELAATDFHACARMSDGKVKCWGDAAFGKLGQGSLSDIGDDPGELAALPPVDLGGLATAIATSEHGSCAVLSTGAVKCWGDNSQGQRGIGSATAPAGDGPGEMGVNLAAVQNAPPGVVDVQMGYLHTCLRTNAGGVRCFGLNGLGQLGVGHTSNLFSPTTAVDLGGVLASSLATHYSHSCIRSANGDVRCWGHNNRGEVGVGSNVPIGDGPGEMGSSLVVAASGTSSISVGLFKSCAVIGMNLTCWGAGAGGQLGSGDTNDWGDNPGEMAMLPGVDLAAPVASVTAGLGHSCAILTSGAVKCWGANGFGQLGQGSSTPSGATSGSMGAALPTTNLGSGRTALQVVTGSNFSCALTDDHRVKCWGSGDDGRTGYGDTQTRGNLPGQMGDALPSLPLP